MHCPFCGSTQVQLHSVVCADGTKHIHLRHMGSVDGRFMQGSSYGTQYTALAQNCAAPAPPSPMPFMVALGFGGLVIYWGAIEHFPYINWKWFLGGLAVIGVAWFLLKSWITEAKEYGAAKKRWQRTFFCYGCGQSHMKD